MITIYSVEDDERQFVRINDGPIVATSRQVIETLTQWQPSGRYNVDGSLVETPRGESEKVIWKRYAKTKFQRNGTTL